MLLPEAVSAALAELPPLPGVYLMKDAAGGLLYVGKSKNLRSRVRSYFQDGADHAPKTRRLVRHVRQLEWLRTDTELEALLLECRLIRERKPPYNRRLKNPDTYAYLAIRRGKHGRRELAVVRRPADGGGGDEGPGAPAVFGPFSSLRWTEGALLALQELYGLLCSGTTRPGSACLNHALGRCMGICRGEPRDREAYEAALSEIEGFLRGQGDAPLQRLERRMLAAADAFDFETAARLRDDRARLQSLQQQERAARFMEAGHPLLLLETLPGAALSAPPAVEADSAPAADAPAACEAARKQSANLPAAEAVGEVHSPTRKLFLLQRNRIVFSQTLSPSGAPTESEANRIIAHLRQAWQLAQQALPPAPELQRDEVDEARILYSWLQQEGSRFTVLDPDWLEPVPRSGSDSSSTGPALATAILGLLGAQSSPS